MEKKKALFLSIALAFYMMSSCVKDSIKDKVVFGNSEGMSVTSYVGVPLVEQYGHFSWGYYIDLNDDGQKDIQFHSQVLGSIEDEQYNLTELDCNHENIALLGEIVNQKFSLSANNANDSFGNDNTFMNTNVILKDSQNYFPMDEEKYIGFKITENGETRLGWMKVILHHDHVELLETAIQK